MAKSRKIDQEITAALAAASVASTANPSERDRYMLVDNRTGKDMRLAHDIEIAEIRRHRSGVAMIQLGGGWNVPAKLYEVRLRDTRAPKTSRAKPGPVPGSPEVTVKSRLYYFGEFTGGKLYQDERSYRTLEAALADVKPRGWRRSNSVIVEQQQVAKGGVIFGLRSVLHSMLDGQILDYER